MEQAHRDALRVRRAAYKLRQNDPAFESMYLPLDDLTELDDITRAVWSNRTVREVSVFCEFLDDDWVTNNMIRLFRSLGNLPKLERLVFDFMGSDGDELPVSLLAAALDTARKLQTLELSCVKLTGNMLDFVAFSRTLRRKPLKKFHMYGSYLSTELQGSPSTFVLDPILDEIANLDTLEDVLLTALDFEALGNLSSENLGRFLHLSFSLKNLVLGEFRLTDQHIVAMSVALEDNNTLHELSFGCKLGSQGANALANMLTNNKKLDTLHMHVSGLDGGEANHVTIANALKRNTTLKRFSLFGTTGNLTTRTQQAFVDMLAENFRLEELEFQDENSSLDPVMEMYLILNAHGRGRLLQSQTTTREDWVSTLIQVHDDLDCVFHLLSLNPAIASLEDSQAARGAKRKR